MNNKCIKYFTAIFIIIFLCSSLSCRNQASPYNNTPSSNTASLYLEDDFYRNLAKWLDLSYLETDEYACFSMYPSQTLENPDLYTTNAVINTLINLNQVQDIEKQSIIDWIFSLRQEQGFYYDSNVKRQVPRVDQTCQAVNILIHLEATIPQRERTIDFLLSLQQSDGLFSYSIDPAISENANIERKIAATNDVVISLTNLKFDDWTKLNKTAETLLQYLNEKFDQEQNIQNIQEEESGNVLSAIWSLALIDRSSAPIQAEQFIIQNIKNIPDLSEDLLIVAYLNNLIEAANVLGLKEATSEETLTAVNDHLLGKVFKQQSKNGLFIEPSMTSSVVKLAKWANIVIPKEKELTSLYEKHRIEGGWVPFVKMNAGNKAQHTFYALNIARNIKYQEYDPNLISKYLQNLLLIDNIPLQEIHYTLMCYKTMGITLTNEMKKNIEKRSIEASQKLEGNISCAPDWGYFALISNEMGFSISTDIKNKMEIAENQLANKIINDALYRKPIFLHLLLSIQSSPDLQMHLSKNDIKAIIMPFLADSGGFKDGSLASSADMHSTYVSLEVLESFGILNDINTQEVIDFVLLAKKQYGFCSVAEQQLNPNDFSSIADLRSTFEALTILDKYGSPR